jgi:LysM repeat protein
MVGRSRARYLAPIALVAAITVTYLVVDGSLRSKSSSTAHPHVLLPTNTAARSKPPAPRQPSVYVVKAGDTLSGISVKTKVPLATLESLNPGVNSNALQTGQRLTLHK